MDKILLKIKRKGYSPLVNYLEYMEKWHGGIYMNQSESRHVYGKSPMAVAKKLLKLMEKLEEDKPIACKIGNAHLIHER